MRLLKIRLDISTFRLYWTQKVLDLVPNWPTLCPYMTSLTDVLIGQLGQCLTRERVTGEILTLRHLSHIKVLERVISTSHQFTRHLIASNYTVTPSQSVVNTDNLRCQIWHPNLVKLVPNGTNLGLLKISFSTFWLGQMGQIWDFLRSVSVHLARRAKMYWN